VPATRSVGPSRALMCLSTAAIRLRGAERRGGVRCGVRVPRLGALLTGIVVLTAVWVSPVSSAGFGVPCAAAAGQVRAWLVVDFGDLPGSPGGVRTVCVTVSEGSTAIAVLQAGVGGLRWHSSGLLCAIGGYPAPPECGSRTPSGYRYWSYWHGGSSWDYAGSGPDSRRVRDGDVEGWHFVSGKGNPTDPPPGASPSSGCPPPATVPTATSPPRPTVPTPPTQPPGPGVGPSAPGSSPGAGPPTSGAGPSAPDRSRPGDQNGAGDGEGSPPLDPTATIPAEPAGDPGAEGTDGTDGSTPTDPAGEALDGEPTARGAGPDSSTGQGLEQAQVAASSAASIASAPAGSSVGLFVGVALIALIGGGAFVQFRRRPSMR